MNGSDRFYVKPQILSGQDALRWLENYRERRIGIITDSFMVSSGMLDMVLKYLPDNRIEIFSGVVPDPTIEVVINGTEALRGLRPEILLAVGGGSTIDTAKAILASLREMPDMPDMTLVAVPTTSGTGSEATEFAVISDTAKGIKIPLRTETIIPDLAILAPELVQSVPPKVTADTGMDVITHCIEAFVSLRATDFADAFAEKALVMSFKWLPRAYDDGSCLIAREKMHNASCMAGMAFNVAGLGLNHGIAHAVGSVMHMAHGRINAMLLPHVIEFNAGTSGDYSASELNEFVAKRYARLAERLDCGAPALRAAVKGLAGAVRRLNSRLGIPATLREQGVDMEKFANEESRMVQAALDDITTTCNRRQPTAQDVEDILTRVAG
ncbi:MAG: 1-propanol dehydrogenase PduQ [Desulfovibrio sp.]|uniref:1-propanol dehydrogenase PduQ n=1 Tax=Desulfovibrio sp. 7SRBS1 TaxID=3378064 RepID=UPI003B41044B